MGLSRERERRSEGERKGEAVCACVQISVRPSIFHLAMELTYPGFEANIPTPRPTASLPSM